MDTRKVSYAVVLTAIAVVLSPFSIPIGPVKIFPVQSMVNVLSGILIGPWYALGVAVAASIIRNITGTGTLFAFPGSMIGAFLVGYVYLLTRNAYLAALGEIIGTGIIAAFVSTLLVAPVFMNRAMDATALVVPFLAAAVTGAIVGVLGVIVLQRAGVAKVAKATE
jgi:energy coupling factor transporter S component ThiW